MKKDFLRFLSLFLVSVMLVPTLASCDQLLADPKESTSTEAQEEVKDPVKYTLTLSADKTTVKRGDTVTLTSLLVAEGEEDLATEEAVYSIVAGGEYATSEGDKLTVLPTAPDGAKITVQASEGASYSNTVTLTVSVPAEELLISAKNNVKSPVAGQMIVLDAIVTPAGAPNNVAWVLTAGADHATLSADGVLTVSEKCPVGTEIKVKATLGALESNELTFTVRSATENIDITSITLSAPSYNVLPGTSIVISGSFEPKNATNSYELVFDAPTEFANINGNVLMIDAKAPAGTVIKVKAVADTVTSKVLTFTVIDTEVAVTNIEIAASTQTPSIGKTVVFEITNVDPDNATEAITYVITEGQAHVAGFEGNVLFVKDDVASVGATIKVKAICACGEKSSEEIVLTVQPAVKEVKIESISISSTATQVLRGGNYLINKVVTPDNATEKALWKIVEGAKFVSFNGDTMVISETAPTGTVIKIACWNGNNISSSELTFTVADSRDEILATTYDILVGQTNFVTDKNGTAIPTLTVEVVNMLGNPVEKEVEFSLVEDGAKYVKLNTNALTCGFKAVGHGTAKVKVKIVGSDVEKIVTVNSIVPPSAVTLPEVFAKRLDINYVFSMENPKTGAPYQLPFVSTPRGAANTIFCQDLLYSFRHADGTEGDDVAVYDYETGMITFKKEGKVTVTVSSASGSKIEANNSYTFIINKAYNAGNFTELNYLARLYDGGNIPLEVNFVVTEKLTGYGGYVYEDYALVPPSALLPLNEQTVAELQEDLENYNSPKNRIQFTNMSVTINGNSHPIDGSKMRIYTETELKEYVSTTGAKATSNISMHSLLSFEPWDYSVNIPTSIHRDKNYTVKFYNVITKGNVGFNYNPTEYNDIKGNDEVSKDNTFIGAYDTGISVGGPASTYNVHYQVEAQNLSSFGFRKGIGFTGVSSGKVSNLFVGDCYYAGITTGYSIMTLENVRLGLCGGTGIELTPSEHKNAGLTNDQLQQVTFAGKIEITDDAAHNLKSTYFNNYTDLGAEVSSVLEGNLQNYEQDPTKVPHVRDTKGNYALVSLLFHDTNGIAADYADNGKIDGTYKNASDVTYSAYEAGGIIDLMAIPAGQTDTIHQFIRVPIYAPIAELGGQNLEVGVALFYNWNYQGN